ncbi:unnamed protein product [Coffea canephora]|uniref:Uncharacterized protein n=1 Tax=Coffea canephora TaxID=49390 RepID=A0A068UFA6_COFCA|nr:unnamed protein product [Coffea canephora]
MLNPTASLNVALSLLVQVINISIIHLFCKHQKIGIKINNSSDVTALAKDTAYAQIQLVD